MLRRAVAALVLPIALVCLACDDTAAGPEDGSAELAGSYSLSTVNGAALPFDDDGILITSATMTLTAAGGVEILANRTSGGEPLDQQRATGTYARSGNTLSLDLDWDGGGSDTSAATWDGEDTIVWMSEGDAFVFKR